MDIRLKSEKYTMGEREYTLTCNMNVLAEVQEQNGGDLLGALDGKRSMRTALLVGAAMLNDCAEENGWPERYTEKTLGRKIPPKDSVKFSAMVEALLAAALMGDDHEEEDTEKN